MLIIRNMDLILGSFPQTHDFFFDVSYYKYIFVVIC
jgi:hypothetical protein